MWSVLLQGWSSQIGHVKRPLFFINQMFFIFQETLKLQFGSYTGEVRDGKPHGQGVFNFNSDDIQVIFNYCWQLDEGLNGTWNAFFKF